MKRIIVALVVGIAFQAFSQNQNLKPFSSVDVFGPFKIEMIQSDAERIEMDFVNVRSEDVVLEVKRGELILKLKSKHYWSDWDSQKHKKAQYINTKIYYKSLVEFKASAGAHVTFNEYIKANKFKMIGSMGAEVWLPINANVLFAKSSMGATVNLKGHATYLEVSGKMGGSVKASLLETQSAYVSASMGSDVVINATEEVDIAANFGADVRFYGNPVVRHTNKKMGADIGSAKRAN